MRDVCGIGTSMVGGNLRGVMWTGEMSSLSFVKTVCLTMFDLLSICNLLEIYCDILLDSHVDGNTTSTVNSYYLIGLTLYYIVKCKVDHLIVINMLYI